MILAADRLTQAILFGAILSPILYVLSHLLEGRSR